jgi:hypothetical protein
MPLDLLRIQLHALAALSLLVIAVAPLNFPIWQQKGMGKSTLVVEIKVLVLFAHDVYL